MERTDNDTLFLTNNISEEVSALSLKDVFLSCMKDTSTWEYDIPSHTMYIEYLDEDFFGKKVVMENYNETVKQIGLVHEEDIPAFDVFCAELDAGKDTVFAEFRGVSGDYQYKKFRYLGNAVPNIEDDSISRVFGRRYEISEEQEEESEGKEKPVQDMLTGLYSMSYAEELIRKEQNGDDETKAALILIDIDKFRDINVAFGKMYGDVVMQTISGLIYTNFMSKDVVGRISGDQFIVYCNDIEYDKVRELIDKMAKRIYQNVEVRDKRHITLSIGVAFAPKDGKSFDELYWKADIALYKAKELGGDRIEEYAHDPMKGIPVGTTFRKKNSFEEDMIRIDSYTKKVNKKLFDFTFDTITKEESFEKALTDILGEVCLHYDLDQAVLIDVDEMTRSIENAVRWCRYEGGNDFEKIKEATIKAWGEYEIATENMTEPYIVLESGRGSGLDFFRNIIMFDMVPVSSILFPIRDSGGLSFMISFDAFEKHEFQENEIITIRSIVRLISSHLISRQIKQKFEMESIINKNVMDAQKIIYYVVDRDTHEVKYASKYAIDFFGRVDYGKKCYESFYGYDKPCDICPIREMIEGRKTLEVYNEEKDRWYSYLATEMKDTENNSDVLVCITDVTEFLHRVKGEDTLTHVDSYDRFMLMSTREVSSKKDEFTVFSLGIAGFSKINDEYGYVVGDEVLKAAAECYKKDVSDGEYLCRIKGDDYVMLLKRTDEDVLRERVSKYSRELTERFRKDYPAMEITVFGGSYDIPYEEDYFNRCLDRAMKAKQVAMENMGSEECFYAYSREYEQFEQERDEMNRKIRYALTHNGFKVYLQPKVNVEDGSIIGAEALVRMVDENGKLVPPGMFIPLAERTGLVIDIDRAVYEKTFEYMQKWKEEGKSVPLISVNVSRLHLIDNSLPEKMKKLTDSHGLDPSEVELEITESIFFEDTERLINMVKALKSMGFVISMDDFGAGYSTLNFMKSLPVDVIKIDGGFFMHNEMDRKNRAVVSAILQLTRNLEFETVSEGVETEEQVKFIKEQGGRCVQGYYYYKPMPAEEFAKLI